MKKKSFSIILVIFIYVIFSLDMLATQYFLYWRFWWFDIMMHFLGGFWISLTAYYLFYFSGYLNRISKKFSVFTLSLTTVIFVGIFWEIFEYVTKVSVAQSNYLLDTYLDLFMDVFGWLASYFVLLKINNKNNEVAEKVELDRIN